MTDQATLNTIERLAAEIEKLRAQTQPPPEREQLAAGIEPGAVVTVMVSGTSVGGDVRTRADVVKLTSKDVELSFDRTGRSSLNRQLANGSIVLGIVEGIERWTSNLDYRLWEEDREAALTDARAVPPSQRQAALAAVERRFGLPAPNPNETRYREPGRWAE